MNLLVVGHVFLSKDALNLFEVPVRDAGHLVDLLGWSLHVPVLTVGPADAETEAVVVALTIEGVHASATALHAAFRHWIAFEEIATAATP